MAEEKRLVTNLTYLDRLAAGPFYKVRLRLVVLVLIIGAIAAVAALYLEIIVKDVNIVDAVFLPLMALSFLLMAVILRRRPALLGKVENLAFSLLVLYAMFMLIYQLRETLPRLHTFSETILWYPMLYLSAFLLHRRATALRLSTGIWSAFLLIGIAFAPHSLVLVEHDASVMNTILQFYVSGAIYIILLYAFSRIEEGYAETRALAYIDYLTQLPNRRYGESMMVQLLRQAREYKTIFSVAMVDLDGFKRINDRFGHDIGDRVLKRCALLVQRYLPRGGRVIRWGGEEFLVILPDLNETQALRVAEEMRRGLETSPHEGVGVVLASFGVAGLRPNDTLDELIMRADQAMYRAKNLGGNRVVAASALTLAAEA